MEARDIFVRLLSESNIEDIILLTTFLNPDISDNVLTSRHREMFKFENYTCFGLYHKDELIGVTSGWTTVRLYSGKQLELDNVIIHESMRSLGLGKLFLEYIEDWARENGCLNSELNTYVQNHPSHKFYHANGYNILGFHFLKKL